MPNTVLPLPDDPSSIVIEPLRTPPRSIVSSSGIPNPSSRQWRPCLATGVGLSLSPAAAGLQSRDRDGDGVQPAAQDHCHAASGREYGAAAAIRSSSVRCSTRRPWCAGKEPALPLRVDQENDGAPREIREHLEP